ncbi:MAG: hypothetical protein NC917_04560 [Candidatus Omnitrophica bacterium]|nr:hypothetical protein [Candidatus Omnitrophota bacterium]
MRRLNPALGETVVVIGLVIIGQLVTQMLNAYGCHVIDVDIDEKESLYCKQSWLWVLL